MVKLIKENNETYSLYGEYETDKDARLAINQYCRENNYEVYYWNCYTMPKDSPYAGGMHIDFGSYNTFFIIY